MSDLKFKKGDFCFYEFELFQVITTEEDRITSVDDGTIISSGYDLSYKCYPVDLKVKNISDEVKYWYGKIKNIGFNSINYPEIKEKFVEIWIELCKNKDNPQELNPILKDFHSFGNEIIEKIYEIKKLTINGTKIFR